MNWLQKVCSWILPKEMLSHAFKAIQVQVDGDWDLLEFRPNLKKTYDLQYYGTMTAHGDNIRVEGDEFVVVVRALVARSKEKMPKDYAYNAELANQWIQENQNPVENFDSKTGNELVYYHCILSGYYPDTQVTAEPKDFGYLNNLVKHQLVEIGNTYDEETPLSTPFAVAEWIRERIDSRGFGGGGNDDNPDEPLFPDWPYPEVDYEDEEDLSRVIGPRIRGNRV